MGLPDHIDVLLPRLHKLTVRKCDLVCLPKSFASLSCLQTLVLYSCGLVTLPSNFGDLPALKLLLLDQLPLSELPSSFFQLNSLESLFLAECDKLPRRPARFCGLTALKAFCITHSSFVLPEDVGALESLEALMLTDYGSPFPASFTELSSLTSLELDNCELGVQLPEALGELTSLRELKISVSHIRTLPVSLLQLTRFQTLRIIACSSLSEVPPSWICSWGLRGCRYCAAAVSGAAGAAAAEWNVGAAESPAPNPPPAPLGDSHPPGKHGGSVAAVAGAGAESCTAALQDAMVTTLCRRVSICTCTQTGHHLATFTRRRGLILYTLATEPPQVVASAQVSASGQEAPPCSVAPPPRSPLPATPSWHAPKGALECCEERTALLVQYVLGGRGQVVLTGHANASWADNSATQRSSQGYTFSLGSGSVSWRSTRSSSALSSSCEAEIYAEAMAVQELRWLTYLLTDLGEQPRSPLVLYVDNKIMITFCKEHRLEHRTKHIALRYFLARELQQRGQLHLVYVATMANTADIFTKALPPGDHQRFSTLLGLVPILPDLLTA
ncbi:unnamed protein product [Closterium sp. NIES-53]